MTKETKLEECFFITPIGANDSDIRRKADGINDVILIPVLKPFGFKPVPAHRISKPGSISEQIIEKIVNHKLVIVDLSGLNPNVMYELALRHTTGLPTVVICEEGTEPPFDLYNERIVFYKHDLVGSQELTKKLIESIESALEEGSTKNPVSGFLELEKMRKNIEPGDVNSEILKGIDSLRRQMSDNKIIEQKPRETRLFITITKASGFFNKRIRELLMKDFRKHDDIGIIGVQGLNGATEFYPQDEKTIAFYSGMFMDILESEGIASDYEIVIDSVDISHYNELLRAK